MHWRSKLILAVALIGGTHSVRAGTVFSFQFDDQGLNGTNLGTDGPIVPPVVGTGQFVSPVDLTPGTYDLTSLPGFTMNFSFNDGATYNQTNIATPLTGVAVRIAAGERLFFTESGGAGIDGGPEMGALDLVNGALELSFEPTFIGGNFVYFEGSSSGGSAPLAGRYLALSPEPGSTALLGSGLIALLLIATRRSRTLFR